MVSTFVLTLGLMAMISTTYTHPAFGIKSKEDWPKACRGKYYCWKKSNAYEELSKTFEKLLSNEYFDYVVGNETEHRSDPLKKDVGSCKDIEMFTKIYMIRDENNVIWYVPQTKNFSMKVQIKECESPNVRITEGDGLDQYQLNISKLQCREQRINFKFPVLYKNEKDKFELKMLSPHKGIPMHCSAKVVK